MAEPQQTSWMRKHAQILAVGGLFVAGLIVGVVGVTAAIGADDDLTDAEAELAQAEQRLADLESEADRAAARLAEAQATSATTLTAAQQVAADGRELCNCDEQIADLAAEALAASLAGREGEYNRLAEEIESWAAQSDALLLQIDLAAIDIGPVGD